MKSKMISEEGTRNQEVIVLKPYEEVAGCLEQLDEYRGMLTAKIADFTVVLPFKMKLELSKLLGFNVTILRTDMPNKEYILRVLNDGSDLRPEKPPFERLLIPTKNSLGQGGG
jgi:hypothetical protein